MITLLTEYIITDNQDSTVSSSESWFRHTTSHSISSAVTALIFLPALARAGFVAADFSTIRSEYCHFSWSFWNMIEIHAEEFKKLSIATPDLRIEPLGEAFFD